MVLEFPWRLRVAHFFNFLFITLLFRSGLQVLASHPKLYWSDDALPGSEWLRVGDRERDSEIETDAIVETTDEEVLWTAEDGLPTGPRGSRCLAGITSGWAVTGTSGALLGGY